MSRARKTIVAAALAALLICVSVAVYAQDPTGRQLIEHVEQLLWGRTSEGNYTMTITTPHWQRALNMTVWMDRPERSFIRIKSPRKEAGVGSLRIKDQMWNYLPKVERTFKIPPSMMLQPWMGSDFSNDDLVKESSVVNDYQHTLDLETKDQIQVYRIESMPKPEAAVVWGMLVYWVRKADLMPLKIEYFDERRRLIKTLQFSEEKKIGGRKLPTFWEMRSTAKPQNSTSIRVQQIEFDQPIAAEIFTLRNLRKH